MREQLGEEKSNFLDISIDPRSTGEGEVGHRWTRPSSRLAGLNYNVGPDLHR